MIFAVIMNFIIAQSFIKNIQQFMTKMQQLIMADLYHILIASIYKWYLSNSFEIFEIGPEFCVKTWIINFCTFLLSVKNRLKQYFYKTRGSTSGSRALNFWNQCSRLWEKMKKESNIVLLIFILKQYRSNNILSKWKY